MATRSGLSTGTGFNLSGSESARHSRPALLATWARREDAGHSAGGEGSFVVSSATPNPVTCRSQWDVRHEEDHPRLRNSRRRAHRDPEGGRVPLSRARALAGGVRGDRCPALLGARHLARTQADAYAGDGGGAGGP